MQKEDCDCVGVDVSKRTLDVALYRGEVDWKNGHIKVENNKTGYKDLKRWFRSNGIKKQKLRICMEYTGLYAHDFRIWLESEGLVYYMVDPNRMHYFEPPLSIKESARQKQTRQMPFVLLFTARCFIRVCHLRISLLRPISY